MHHEVKSEVVNAPIIDEFPYVMECELAEVIDTENMYPSSARLLIQRLRKASSTRRIRLRLKSSTPSSSTSSNTATMSQAKKPARHGTQARI